MEIDLVSCRNLFILTGQIWAIDLTPCRRLKNNLPQLAIWPAYIYIYIGKTRHQYFDSARDDRSSVSSQHETERKPKARYVLSAITV